MPTRKSTAAAGADSPDVVPAPKSAPKDDGLNIEDLNLPKSIVQRLAKGCLPPNTQIQKDAALAMSKSATVFVNYLTSHAAEFAEKHNRKTVNPSDVYEAMHELEFDLMITRLQAETSRFTAIQADKRNSYRKKIREEKKALKDPSDPAPPVVNGHATNDGVPPAKRARRSSGDNGGHASSDEDMEVDEAVEDVQDEDEEVEDDEIEEEPVEEGLTEDPIEVLDLGASDDDMIDRDDDSD